MLPRPVATLGLPDVGMDCISFNNVYVYGLCNFKHSGRRLERRLIHNRMSEFVLFVGESRLYSSSGLQYICKYASILIKITQ